MDLLYINNKLIDLEEQTNIKITQQVNDIAQLETRQATYTNTIKVPKTKNNIRNLDGLSLNSDVSRIPYQKNTCVYIKDGVHLIHNGWAVIKSTSDTYSIYIYEGIIDLFKDLENHTIGNYLDLSEINHVRNMENVINSFTNENYRYIITDYNGKTNVENFINIDYLVPSARILYLWNQIQKQSGWTFLGEIFKSDDFLNLWITYPNPVVEDEDTNIDVASASRITSIITHRYLYNTVGTYPRDEMYVDTAYKDWITEFEVIAEEAEKTGDNWSVRVLKDGEYLLDFTLNGVIDQLFESYAPTDPQGYRSYRYSTPIQLIIQINGVDREIIIGNTSGNDLIDTKRITLQRGDIISLALVPYLFADRVVQEGHPESIADTKYKGAELLFTKLEMNVTRLSAGEADFSVVFQDFKITDFLKEILWQFGLTVYIDKYQKIAYFLTMKERLEDATLYDFTNYYKQRTNEQYQLSTYAQQNRFKYKYNDEQSEYNDGLIIIDDINLEDEKTVIESVTYTVERQPVSFQIQYGFNVMLNVFPIWTKEPTESPDGEIGINYKGLEKRYYFIRSFERVFPWVSFISEILGQTQTGITRIPLADYSGLSFNEIVDKNYEEISKILNDSRIHTIELDLPLPLVSNFDIKGLYYFQQEAQYYFCNRLSYSNTKVTGEFVRVKYTNLALSCPIINELSYENSLNENGTQNFKLMWARVTSDLAQNIRLYMKTPGSNTWRVLAYLSKQQSQISLYNNDRGLYSFRFEIVGECENSIEVDNLPGFTDIGIQ